MKQCLSCNGLVPDTLDVCPNCAVTRRKKGLKVVAAASLVSLALSNCGSQMALYGVPCTSKQVDGGNNGCLGACDTLLPDGGDPRKDRTSSCFTDGGTP
ncbi:MAG: hypothetical protein JNJ54_30030 [Myxococcaceae bacterium]|nr:hypothetical protein [Myxococcaceae bacterium]